MNLVVRNRTLNRRRKVASEIPVNLQYFQAEFYTCHVNKYVMITKYRNLKLQRLLDQNSNFCWFYF